MGNIKKKIICLHSVFLVVNIFLYYEKICTAVGKENVAYGISAFGSNLQEDILSRGLCFFYSLFLAIGIVVLSWNGIFALWSELKNKNKIYKCMLLLIVIGVCVIFCLYPNMYGMETNDDYMNYVYAKEFLPMYWHAFLTNVVYCGVSIVFIHPISIPIFQYICSIVAVFYLLNNLWHLLEKRWWRGILICFTVLLFVIPETFRIIVFPTRNCMYGVVCLWVFVLLAVDNLKKNELTRNRVVGLCILFAILGTWRGEGVVYAVCFPVFVWTVYYRGKELKIRKLLKLLCLYGIIFFLFALPDKYGTAKYQNKDYMITNTTGPLSAVFHNSDANLSYDGVKEDLENIEKIVPFEIIYDYGCNSSALNNARAGRWIIQTGANKEDANNYMKSAYRILLYNFPTYLKYELNYFLDANVMLIGKRFSIDFGKQWLDDYTLSTQGYKRLYEFYEIGKQELDNRQFVVLNYVTDDKIEEIIARVLNWWYIKGRNFFSWFKIGILIAQFVILIVSLYRKEWFIALFSIVNLGILCIIVLVAPWARPNYYYSVFLNMYCCLGYFLFGSLKQRIVCSGRSNNTLEIQ